MELDEKKLVAALKGPQVMQDLDAFAKEHALAVSPEQILQIAKAVCKVADVVCPIVESL